MLCDRYSNDIEDCITIRYNIKMGMIFSAPAEFRENRFVGMESL